MRTISIFSMCDYNISCTVHTEAFRFDSLNSQHTTPKICTCHFDVVWFHFFFLSCHPKILHVRVAFTSTENVNRMFYLHFFLISFHSLFIHPDVNWTYVYVRYRLVGNLVGPCTRLNYSNKHTHAHWYCLLNKRTHCRL